LKTHHRSCVVSDQWSLWKRNVVDKYKSWPSESIKKDLQSNSNPFAVCMEHWSGDFNIGTLIRNANAFNAKEVFYLGKKRFDPRGAVGSHHYVNITHLENSYSSLYKLKKHYSFVAVDNNMPNTTKLAKFDWNILSKPPLFLFGEECSGLTDQVLKMADYIIEIEQYGSVRSLNVATSSGILIHDFVRFLKNSTDPNRSQREICGEIGNVQSESRQLILL
jgi:tRNA G18 (ribose-2'-O)-methylase SpoU